MNIKYKKNLRRSILQRMYEISEGRKTQFVPRINLGIEFGFDNGMHPEFSAAMGYLKDRFLIEYRDTVHHSITTDGIDEVENNYPNLPGVSVYEDDSAYVEFHLMGVNESIDKFLIKNEKGLIKGNELEVFENKIREKIKKILDKASEEDRLIFEKTFCIGMRNMLKSGFQSKEFVLKKITPYKKFVNETLEKITGESYKSEMYMEVNKPYTSRKYLRNIFNSAENEIYIIDS